MLAPDTLWIPIIEGVFKSLHLEPPSVPGFWERSAVLFILAVAVVALNFIWARHQIMPPSEVAPSDADSQFSTAGYIKLRDEFCRYMIGQLDQYDRDVHWSDSDYTELEAEVEMDRQGALRPKVVHDLIKAIRSDHDSRAFLLLGDPGSGKSVSLRRLCRVLYTQTRRTGIVPVCLNLREWDGPAEPSDGDISNFILRHLRFQSGRSGMNFLNAWFTPMLDRGLFFFILDSFDEMPAVLDCDDSSNRLQRISAGFNRFFNDLHRCRGVLASRMFRQPRGFRGRRLSIRPFSEGQVRAAIKRWLLGSQIDADKTLVQLLREKPQLASAVRNPFSADLLAQFFANNLGKLPESYFSVFEDYIQRRLAEDTQSLAELKVSSGEVLDSATRIAWAMYRAEDVGLEVDTPKLRLLVNNVDLDRHLTALRALRGSRLARLGGSQIQRFSFAHRRFAEFFVVRALVRFGEEVPLSSIPEDSRWRDCLAVYCGIAPEADSRRIAEYAWSAFKPAIPLIQGADLVAARPAVHCLRFLVDSFRGRLECIESFRDELSSTLLELLGNKSILVSKIAAEGLCLARDTQRDEGLAVAVERGTAWVAETAIRSCRNLSNFSERSARAITTFIATLPSGELFRRFQDLSFSFSLSEGFRRIRWGLKFDLFSIIVAWTLWVAGVLAVLSWWKYMLIEAQTKTQVEQMLPYLCVGILFLSPFMIELFYIIRASTKPFQPYLGFTWRSQFDTGVRLSLLFFATFGLTYFPFIPDLWFLYCVLLPWRTWVWIFLWARKPKRFPSSELIKQIIKAGLVLVGAIAAIVAIFAGIVLLLKGFAGEPATKLVGAAVVALFWGVILFIFGRSVTVAARDCLRDRQALANIETPQVVTRTWVFEVCKKLNSSWGRKRFLETLLIRGVRASDAPQPLSGHWVDDGVRERLARLEEKWLGLEL